ncbi:hypothetical protein DYU11_24045 [Fibrisoma montanum]|uniref:Uncharacterized protein n=1 Tax=Fibrisoma montanum TaxID=2305895 RepID=A0A418M359_9BACT|nr:hypothetical protein [Fibrisoma montanum]RIV19990.1 hypothetical protein DYU11_24045 [Fibrisoma montanum]
MNTATNVLRSLGCTVYAFQFIKVNFLPIFGLGLVAAFGRAIQLKAFGPISPLTHTSLEVVIESARILLFFYALGLTNVRTGFTKLAQFVKDKAGRSAGWRLAVKNLRERWLTMLINFVAFLLIAWLFNALINHIAYETCLYITLQSRQLLSEHSSEWVLILFFKNISVIPFTLIFQAILILWLTNRLPTSLT